MLCIISGEAIYVDDIPKMKKELHIAFVISNKAHAKLKQIDTNDAMKLKGVVAFFSAKDIDPSRNRYTMIIENDEWLFAEEFVYCVGQVIGVIAAETPEIAQKAADMVKVDYEVLKPVITMEEAIENKSFHPLFASRLKNTQEIQKDLDDCHVTVKGQTRSGAQEHFYMESNACLAGRYLLKNLKIGTRRKSVTC